MEKYNKNQLEEMNNMLEKLKQPEGITIPIDCYRNFEMKTFDPSYQNQFFF